MTQSRFAYTTHYVIHDELCVWCKKSFPKKKGIIFPPIITFKNPHLWLKQSFNQDFKLPNMDSYEEATMIHMNTLTIIELLCTFNEVLKHTSIKSSLSLSMVKFTLSYTLFQRKLSTSLMNSSIFLWSSLLQIEGLLRNPPISQEFYRMKESGLRGTFKDSSIKRAKYHG